MCDVDFFLFIALQVAIVLRSTERLPGTLISAFLYDSSLRVTVAVIVLRSTERLPGTLISAFLHGSSLRVMGAVIVLRSTERLPGSSICIRPSGADFGGFAIKQLPLRILGPTPHPLCVLADTQTPP